MADLNGKSGFEFGEFVLNPETKILRHNGEVVPLPLKAVELLSVLIENRGEVVSKDLLMERIWGDAFVEDSVLTQNIYILRKAFKSSGSAATIKNIPRRGYVFEYDPIEQKSLSNDSLEAEKVVSGEVGSFPAETRNAATTKGNSHRRQMRWVLVTSVLLFVSAAGFTAYRYLNGENRISSNTSSRPLRLVPVGQPSALKTVAVLPFQGTDKAAGASFSRDISIRLGSINKFNVIPLHLIQQYETFGVELRADFVLNGELTIAGQNYSAVARLVNTTDNSEIWSRRFDFDNVIQLQDVIANAAGRTVIEGMTDAERESVEKRLPTNLSAYEHFQKGVLLQRDRRNAEAQLKKAIELDASLGRAYAALALSHAMSGLWEEAETTLQNAFELDDNLADAYAVQGFIRIFQHRDWDGALKSLQNAIELDAGNVNARHWLGVYHSIHRRLDEAETEMKTALALDPTNPTLLADIGQLYYFAGQRETAVEYCNRALEIDPEHSFASEYLPTFMNTTVFDRETLLMEAEGLLQKSTFALPYLNVDPKYESLRSDPRFRKVLIGLGF
ncbi:MAG: winged helix-turn-helix domain-containing protein [Acidobacteria bacterium]|nr:winged helix-turn-helix domain-containing protein [Acidobacteriota bacterium]